MTDKKQILKLQNKLRNELAYIICKHVDFLNQHLDILESYKTLTQAYLAAFISINIACEMSYEDFIKLVCSKEVKEFYEKNNRHEGNE